VRGDRGRGGKNEEEEQEPSRLLPSPSLPPPPPAPLTAGARRQGIASHRCARACVPEEFDVSGDYGMDAGAEKCRDAAAAAGEAGSDLYAVLGLKKECSDAELKVAYRKLAMVSNWIHLVS
jgi:hypothetical protein